MYGPLDSWLQNSPGRGPDPLSSGLACNCTVGSPELLVLSSWIWLTGAHVACCVCYWTNLCLSGPTPFKLAWLGCGEMLQGLAGEENSRQAPCGASGLGVHEQKLKGWAWSFQWPLRAPRCESSSPDCPGGPGPGLRLCPLRLSRVYRPWEPPWTVTVRKLVETQCLRKFSWVDFMPGHWNTKKKNLEQFYFIMLL